MIPQAAPYRRIARFRKDVDAAIANVVSSDSYVLGKNVRAFEDEFAAYCGLPYCVGTASGTDALMLALRALGTMPGDVVITTALTATATAQAILQVGAVPRFVDVDPVTRCIDPAAVDAAITPQTRAIVAVHLFGHPCDMPVLMEIARRNSLIVVEDCAQAAGATLAGQKLGSFGHAAAFSFYPTKNLGAIGDAGAVLMWDVAIADEIRSLSTYGYGRDDRISRKLGFNSRLDEIQASILRTLLPHLDSANAERRDLAARYRTRLGACSVGLPPESDGCVYHQFAVTSPDRDGLRRHLAQRGISTVVHYTPGLHQHPAFATDCPANLTETEQLAASLLSLPIQPEVAVDTLEQIAGAVVSF